MHKLRKTLYPKEYKGKKEKSFQERLKNDKFEEMINVFEDDNKTNYYMNSQEDKSPINNTNNNQQNVFSQYSLKSNESSPLQRSMTGKSVKSMVSRNNNIMNNINVEKVEYKFLKSYAFPDNLEKSIKTEDDMKNYGREIDPLFNQKLNENLQSRYKVLKISENIVEQFKKELKQEKVKVQKQKKYQFQSNQKQNSQNFTVPNQAYIASNEKFKFPQQRIKNSEEKEDEENIEQNNAKQRKRFESDYINSKESSLEGSPNTKQGSFFLNKNSLESPDIRNRLLSKISNTTDFYDPMSSSIDISVSQSKSRASKGLSVGRKNRTSTLNNEQSILSFQNKIRTSSTYSDIFNQNNLNSDNFDQLPENIEEIQHTLYDKEKRDLYDKQNKMNRAISQIPIAEQTNKQIINQYNFIEKFHHYVNQDPLIQISNVVEQKKDFSPKQDIQFQNHLNSTQRDLFFIQDSKIQEKITKNERKELLNINDVNIDQQNINFEDMCNLLSNRIPVQQLKKYIDGKKVEQNVKEVIVNPKEVEQTFNTLKENENNQVLQQNVKNVDTINKIGDFKKNQYKNQLLFNKSQKDQTSVGIDANPKEIIMQAKNNLEILTDELKTIKNAVDDAKYLPKKVKNYDQIQKGLENKYELKVYEIIQHILHPEIIVYSNQKAVEYKNLQSVKKQEQKNKKEEQLYEQGNKNNVILEVNSSNSSSDSYVNSSSENSIEQRNGPLSQNNNYNNNSMDSISTINNKTKNQKEQLQNFINDDIDQDVLKIEKNVLLQELQELIADEKRILNSKVYGEKMSSVLYYFYYDFENIINLDKQRNFEKNDDEDTQMFQELEKLQDKFMPFYMRDYKKGSQKLRKLNSKNLNRIKNKENL